MARIVISRPDPARVAAHDPATRAFHRSLPGYAPTPLVALPDVARATGLSAVHVKDESARLGLPSFKVLGASVAVARAIAPQGDRLALPELAAEAQARGVRRLAAATDGNHGRAVARMARLLGLGATIHVPPQMVEARRAALRDEGADVVEEAGGYDAAVLAAAADGADPTCRVVNDADPDGASQAPADVIAGYATLFDEIEEALPALPGLLVLQAGVGSFAAAGIRWAASRGVAAVVVEPAGCACIAASIEAGAPVTIESAGTIMAGLDCPTPSTVAWPDLLAGLAGVVVIDDDDADAAARVLLAAGVESGESGAAGLAGLLALAHDPACAPLREALGWDGLAGAVVISTEGATDPERFARVVAGTAG